MQSPYVVYDINHKSPMNGAFSAERVGFEPTENLRLHRFSRPADSTTLAPFRVSEETEINIRFRLKKFKRACSWQDGNLTPEDHGRTSRFGSRKSLPLHASPCILAAEIIPNSFDPPPRSQLTIAEILQNTKREQHCQITRIRVPLEGQLFEEHGANGVHHTIKKSDDKEEKPQLKIERSHDQQHYHRNIAEKLYDWTQQFHEHKVRHGSHAYNAVLWIQKHFPMDQHRVEKTAMPSIPLPGENFDRIRRLCPAHRIWNKHDAVPLALLSLEPV
jgi:hypothetical protein